MNDEQKLILGSGLAFPLQTNARGEILLVSAAEDIAQSIQIILGTRVGERVMRPTFGCKVHDLLFEPRTATTMTLVRKYVEEALRFWEPRVQVLAINTELEPGNDGAIYVDIEYQIKATHDTRSIVYPFFLSGEEEELA